MSFSDNLENSLKNLESHDERDAAGGAHSQQRRRDQRATVRSLGLRRMNAQAQVDDNAVIRGMLKKVRHLVQVQETEGVA